MNKLLALLIFASSTSFAGDWQTLFDGKTLEGWKTNPERGCWTVKDGLLTGMEDAEKLGSYLETLKEYKDFTFECEARWNEVADSGFMVRKEQRIHVNIGMSPSMKRDMTASLYLIKAGGYVAEAKVATLLKPGEWNQFKVELRGRKLSVWLNGGQVVEYEQDQFMEAGPIGLQCHKETPGLKIEFRHLRVMEL